MRLVAILAAFAVTSMSSHAASAAKCNDVINPNSPVESNGFGFNKVNSRNQSSAIDSGNVATLSLAYTQVAKGVAEKRGAIAATEQTVYFSEGRDIVAANRQSGCEYWRFSAQDRKRVLGGAKNHIRSSVHYLPPSSSGPAIVYAGDAFGIVYAVNAVTGKQVWSTFAGTDRAHHQITGSFQVHDGTLFVPVATNEVFQTLLEFWAVCCQSHGMLQALDAYTGKIKWTYHTARKAKFNIWTWTKGPNGMSVWSTPMIDEENNAVVIGTGQNLSHPTTDNSNSLISLDLKTGRVKWVFQTTKNDAWNAACGAPKLLDLKCPRPEGLDFDIGAPPIMVKRTDGRKAIIAGAKNGVVYSVDPATGALQWLRRLGSGGSLGGIHWGMAVDDKHVYAAVSDLFVNKMTRIPTGIGGIDAATSASMSPVQNATPGIYALDLLNGKIKWERHIKHQYKGKEYESLFSAALAVTNDVLFAGSLNGGLHAIRTSDGQSLWSFNSAISVTGKNGVQGNGGTIDSAGPVPAGRDVYLNSGYSSFGGTNPWQGGLGNAMFVFRLPDAAKGMQAVSAK